MKLKITKPDGCVFEAEGTLDECAQLAARISPMLYYYYASPPVPVLYPPIPLDTTITYDKDYTYWGGVK